MLNHAKAWLLSLFVVLTASGCASLSPYAISEGEIEGHLKDVVAEFDRKQLQSGSPLSLSLDDVLDDDGDHEVAEHAEEHC